MTLQKIGNVVISRRKPMKYEVLVSEHYATSVVVDAGGEKEAMDKVDQGDWYDNDIVKKKLIDSFTVQAEAVDNDE